MQNEKYTTWPKTLLSIAGLTVVIYLGVGFVLFIIAALLESYGILPDHYSATGFTKYAMLILQFVGEYFFLISLVIATILHRHITQKKIEKISTPLSGENISFRPLSIKDLPRLHKWLLSAHVSKWYDNGRQTFEEIQKKYTPRINGDEPTSCFQILYKDIPIGQIQMYKINDYPDYKQSLSISENAAGIDLFIGEKKYQHRGLGKHIISKFLHDYVFNQLDVECCVIGPEPNNIAAIKAYQKVGFEYLKTITNPDGEKEYIMKLSK
ncbi:GNAT family N-acetyltransferase [Candidatus Nomurabacteria bacterium]|nr:GNAT family N-acetyltransferase [Candidatus Nomurabacteria bacterium]